MQKGSQNGTKNDATTHHKSVPQPVTRKIMKIITLKFIVKRSIFYGLEGCMRTEKVSTKTSKVRPISIQKSMKHRYKFHARKRDTQDINIH